MRTLQNVLHSRRAAAIGLAVVLTIVTLTGLVYVLPSKAAPRPASHGPRSVASPAHVFRPPSHSTDWPMFNDNPAHTGDNATEKLLSPVTAPGLGLTWRDDISAMCGGCYTGWSPTVAGGVVYIEAYAKGSFSGTLFALNEMTGSLLWRFDATGYMEAAPAVVGDVVYVTNYAGTLYALNATTGKLLWSCAGVNAGVRPSPTVVGGIVYIGGSAVNATTGKLVWSYTSVWFSASPTVVNGVDYLVADNGLYALNAATGALLWKYTGVAGRNVTTSAVVVNGVVYFAWFNLYALNATTGGLLWENAHGGFQPAVAKGIVYVGDDKLYAYDAATGATVWSVDEGSNSGFSRPSVANGVVYFSSGYSNAGYPGDTLYAIDAKTGAKLWMYTADDTSVTVVANDMVFAATVNSGGLYAFHPAIRPHTPGH